MPEVRTNIRAYIKFSASFLIKILTNQPEPAQTSINQRLKILIKALGLSVRAFSATLEVPESSTRNYLDKGTKLNSEYIERIAHHFSNINLNWFITGIGEPLSDRATSTEPSVIRQKNNTGNNVGVNHGKSIQQQGSLPGNEAALLKEIEFLKAQLEMKDTVIAAKDETIDLLKAAFNRPN